MNFWKAGFFILSGLVVATVVTLVVYIGNPGDSEEIPSGKVASTSSNHLVVKATKEDFEGIANTYINKAMKGEKLPVKMEIGNDIVLSSELTVFSITVPVTMHFDPIVREDGNLILKQSTVEIGNYNLPPSTVLKILRDSVKLPPWMIVRPKEEELFIDLSAIALSGNLSVKAKEFNLENDEILLEIIIPNE
ncbi:YpmS family protein [Sporosarcina siberiensis]|uniref:YpmS family protein n=1 Tax=Sporosarcina siberiensis TaxID=1365606 RepID=A0ABW4SH08_9BACL